MPNETDIECGRQPPGRLNPAQWRAIIAHSPLFFEVIGDSMAPTFRAGDHVLIRPLREGEPRNGQVVAYFRTMLITHRYLGNGICRGDNFLDNDLPVRPEDMIGIVTEIKRAGRVVPIGDTPPIETRIHRLILGARRVVHGLLRTR